MKSWLRKRGYPEKIVYQELKNWTFWSRYGRGETSAHLKTASKFHF